LLESPNGVKDEYPFDNAQSSMAAPLPIYGNQLILVLATNNDSTHNAYKITDASGQVIKERKLGSLIPNTIYRDTIDLSPGCYNLIVIDTAGDGLDFWANSEGGYGYVRLLDLNGHLIKSFNSDFGSEINHSFIVEINSKPIVSSEELPLVAPFPIRNKGKFTIDIFFNEYTSTTIKIANQDSSKIVFEKNYPDLKDAYLPIDISSEPDGFYIITIITTDKTVTRKIKVKHED
jgi:hypothetical protein